MKTIKNEENIKEENLSLTLIADMILFTFLIFIIRGNKKNQTKTLNKKGKNHEKNKK
jgi:hypothetical protein